MKITKNNSGDITLIQINSAKLNAIAREVVKYTENNLDDGLKNGVKIPFLAFTGLSFLSGYGKEVNFKSLSVSSVNCDFSSEFISGGINQTLHKISVIVDVEISINFSFYRESRVISTSILVSESVLVGKVPEIYLNNKGLS